MVKNRDKFTVLQREILAHRLDVPDAVAEAIDGTGTFADLIADACKEAAAALWLPNVAKLAALSPLAKECLIEAVEGSTYLGTLEHGNEYAKLAAGKSLTNAAQKIADVLGRSIQLPPECGGEVHPQGVVRGTRR